MSLRPAASLGNNLRPELRDSLEEFDLEADQAGFVGLQIAPALEVDMQSGEYGRLSLKE